MRHNGRVSPRTRLIAAAGLPLLALALAGIVWAGLRSRPSAGAEPLAAPLIAPRFARPPRLALEPLTDGRVPRPLRVTWSRAVSDNEVALQELRRYPIVINFWASWCDPCRREAPELERTWRAERGRVLFLGVNQNDSAKDARAFIRRFGITYPSVREAGDATAIRWRVGGFPVTFFVTADGRVVAQTIGQLRPRQLERGIAAARTGTL